VTALVHMAVGGAVGSLVGGRGGAFALGVASHVPLDVGPHYEFGRMWIEVIVVSGVLGGMVVTGHAGSPVFWGAVGAVAPDIENVLWRSGALPEKWKLFPGHALRLWRFFPHGRTLGTRHIWWQVVLGAAAVALAVWNSLRRGIW
jgi:hypothetical protein